VTTHFDDGVGAAGIRRLTEKSVCATVSGRREFFGVFPALFADLQELCRGESDAAVSLTQNVCEECGGGGFAIRAGHADYDELTTRITCFDRAEKIHKKVPHETKWIVGGEEGPEEVEQWRMIIERYF
jgi:hypothetical protein